MPILNFTVIPLGGFAFSGATPSHNTGSGSGWGNGSYTFSVPGGSTVTATVNDADGVLQDDPTHPEWSGGTWAAHSQVLEAPLTINGKTWAKGTTIDDEYEFDATGSDGITYRIVALSVLQNNALQVVGYTFEGKWPPPDVTLTSVQGSHDDGQSYDPSVICFTPGVRIAVPGGERPVEDLRPGDPVLTADGRAEPLVWTGRRALVAADLAAALQLRPVRIRAGALGAGLPRRDLAVSPQHRLLVRSRVVGRMTGGGEEALVPAKALAGWPGIAVEADCTAVDYIHVMCHAHEVILAEGAALETLLAGPMALRMMGAEARAEIAVLFPALLRDGPPPRPARPILPRRRVPGLLRRLGRNGIALVA